jgi:hypothetical protein
MRGDRGKRKIHRRPDADDRNTPRNNNALDDSRLNDYRSGMRSRLKEELKQERPFESPEAEAFLEIQRTAQVSARWIAGALRPMGLTPAQFNVMRILRGAGPEGHASGANGHAGLRSDPPSGPA